MHRQIAKVWREGFRNPRIGRELEDRLKEAGFVDVQVQELVLATPTFESSDIVFDITRRGDRTELRFTHVGLVPAAECYGDCSDAWSFYINDSLHSLITTGTGKPLRKEQALPAQPHTQTVRY